MSHPPNTSNIGSLGIVGSSLRPDIGHGICPMPSRHTFGEVEIATSNSITPVVVPHDPYENAASIEEMPMGVPPQVYVWCQHDRSNIVFPDDGVGFVLSLSVVSPPRFEYALDGQPYPTVGDSAPLQALHAPACAVCSFRKFAQTEPRQMADWVAARWQRIKF